MVVLVPKMESAIVQKGTKETTAMIVCIAWRLNKKRRYAVDISFYFPAICNQTCRNGGRCSQPNECQCPNGFYGTECEKEIEKHFHHPNITKTVRLPFGLITCYHSYIWSMQEMRYLVSGHIGQISKPRACISWNSNQYLTFDGRQYFFPGRCVYDLASHTDELFHIRVRSNFLYCVLYLLQVDRKSRIVR